MKTVPALLSLKDIEQASTHQLKLALAGSTLIVKTYSTERAYAKLHGKPFAPKPNKYGKELTQWKAEIALLRAAIKARKDKIAN